mgnify:CR=1 FL=1
MARTRINSRSKDLIKDNGSVLVSVVHGEQIKLEMVLSWLTNLSGYQITAKAAEADMTGVSSSNNELPTQRTALEPAELPILDSDPADNKFDIVIPEHEMANHKKVTSICLVMTHVPNTLRSTLAKTSQAG